MKTRSIALAAIALVVTSAALAAAPAPKLAEPQPVPREQTLLDQLAADARDILSAVVPEIALPKLELALPKLDRDGAN